MNERPALSRPRIVCLCGSTRFIEQHAIKAWEIERDEGAIAIGCHLLPASYPGVVAHHQAEEENVAARLDALHRQKIDLADEIFVVNVGGYVGERTRDEIAYAQSLGKGIRWLARGGDGLKRARAAARATQLRWVEFPEIEDGFGGWHSREWRLSYRNGTFVGAVTQRDLERFTVEVCGYPLDSYSHRTLRAAKLAVRKNWKSIRRAHPHGR